MGGSQAPGLDRMGQGLTSLAQVKGKAAGEEGRRKNSGVWKKRELQNCNLVGMKAGATLLCGSGSAACPPTSPWSVWGLSHISPHQACLASVTLG